jgi:hypothetical protein
VLTEEQQAHGLGESHATGRQFTHLRARIARIDVAIDDAIERHRGGACADGGNGDEHPAPRVEQRPTHGEHAREDERQREQGVLEAHERGVRAQAIGRESGVTVVMVGSRGRGRRGPTVYRVHLRTTNLAERTRDGPWRPAPTQDR